MINNLSPSSLRFVQTKHYICYQYCLTGTKLMSSISWLKSFDLRYLEEIIIKFKTVGNNAAEVLTDSGWYYIGPPLPQEFYQTCLVAFDDGSVMIIGGSAFGDPTTTYIFTPGNGSWTLGILMNILC